MRRIALLTTAFLLLDQLTKILVGLYLHAPFAIIPDFFHLTYTQNTGIAFSIDLPRMVIIFLNLILIGLIIYGGKKELNLKLNSSKVFVALILGGALGNLVDRIFHGFVIDFISIWIYPVFNLADIFITLGVLLIILKYGKIKALKK